MFFSQKRFIYLREIVCIGILICMLGLHGRAEEKSDFADYPQQVTQYLQCLFSEGQHKYAFRSDYPGGFDTWQKQARPVLSKLVGLDKISEQVGHHVSKVELMQTDDLGEYTRQQGWIETEPHVRIKIWLLKPKKRGPFPLAILPHGHDSRGYDTSAGYHCDCNLVPGILEFGEMYDIAGLVAPRHIVAVNGRKDSLHSAADINRSVRRAQAIFTAAGCPDRFEHRWGNEGHRFYKDLMWDFVTDALRK